MIFSLSVLAFAIIQMLIDKGGVMNTLKRVVYYDRSLRLWVGYFVDEVGNQIGNAEYASSKKLVKTYLDMNERSM